MRIAGDSTLSLLSALNSTRAEGERALEEISSGKRIAVASDDPAGIAAWLENRSAASRNDEFQHSISTATAVLQTADSTLNSVVTNLNRAITLGVRGSTGSLSQADRDAVAEETEGILRNVADLANTNFRGIYLFAGTASKVKPFQADAESQSGWRYLGNSAITQIEIGGGRTMQMNVPGDQIFMSDGANVFSSLANLTNALRTGDVQSTIHATSAVRAAFENVTCQRVYFGNALSQLSTQGDALHSEALELAQQESEIAGADQAESISRFLTSQTVCEETLAAAGKISRLSLLDYLQ